MNCVLLLDDNSGPAPEVESAEELACINAIGLNRSNKLKLNICCSLRQYDFDLVVLGQRLVVCMHEVDFQNVLVWTLLALVKVMLRRHLIALVPVSLPLAEDREAWLNTELYSIRLPESITSANISNIVIVVETRYINWKGSSKAVDSILSMARINVRHVVYAGELSVDSSRLVEQVVVFVHGNRSPVRHINVTSSFREVWQRVREIEEQLYLAEGQGLN